jgi:hypothetical protein
VRERTPGLCDVAVSHGDASPCRTVRLNGDGGVNGASPRCPSGVTSRSVAAPLGDAPITTPLIAGLAGAVATLYVLPLLLAVLALRFKWRAKVPTVTAVAAAWLDKRWTDGARATLEQLTEQGFVLRTYLDGIAPKTSPTGTRCVALLANESTGDMAQVAIVDRLDDDGEVEQITLPIFTFRAGSKRVATSNSDTPGLFLRPRDHVAHAFPMLHDVATLYKAHRAICESHVGTRRGELPASGNEVTQTKRDTAEEFAYQATRGMMRPTREGDYEATWRGASRSVWKLHPRFVRGHKRRMRARGLRILQELGITLDQNVGPQVSESPVGDDQLSPKMKPFIG